MARPHFARPLHALYKCSKWALPLLVIATFSLSTCATAPSGPSVICPPVAAYDSALQVHFANEIQRFPPSVALERAMLDSAQFYNQARACAMRPTHLEVRSQIAKMGVDSIKGHAMQTMSAHDGFGRLIHLARVESVAVEKQERPVVVVLAVEEYERLNNSEDCGSRQKTNKRKAAVPANVEED